MALAVYLLVLAALAFRAPVDQLAAAPIQLLPLAAVALWRHGWLALHLGRACWYRTVTFPRWRRQAERLAAAHGGDPDLAAPELFVLVTAGGDAATRLAGYDAVMSEARLYPGRVTLVALLSEPGERRLLKQFHAVRADAAGPRLLLVAADGGDGPALARGLRAVARRIPARHALVLVQEGGTVLPQGCFARAVPLLTALPWAAALVADLDCLAPEAGAWRRARLRLRLALRHVHLSSLALSGRLPDLGGGVALYRADIATDPLLIADLAAGSDGPAPPTAGRMAARCLLRHGCPMLYVPDLRALGVTRGPRVPWQEDAARAACADARCLTLGPDRLGWFVWGALLERRLSPWVALVGPLAALLLGLLANPAFLLAYLVWVLATRLLATFLLLLARPAIDGLWPALLFVDPLARALRRGRAEAGGRLPQLLAIGALAALVAWATGALPLPTAASPAALP